MSSLLICIGLFIAAYGMYSASTKLVRDEFKTILEGIEPKYRTRVTVAFHSVAALVCALLVIGAYVVVTGLFNLLVG